MECGGYLNLLNGSCGVHIPNVTKDLDHQLDDIKGVAKASRELRAGLEGGWLNKILNGLGYSLTGWLESSFHTL